MRVIQDKERMTVDYITTSIKCDRCSKETLHGEYGDREGTTFRLDFGYGSRFDLDRWDVDICDDCAEWLQGQFQTVGVEHDVW